MIEISRKHLYTILAAALAMIAGTGAAPESSAPDLSFDSVPNLLKLPENLYLGEVGGVATNSKGHIFVFTRSGDEVLTVGGSRAFLHGGSRLLEFDQNGVFIHEIGHGIYGFMSAHAVRIDSEDNIWTVDEQSNMVIKFAPDGRFVMALGRKPESVNVPVRAPEESTGLGIPGDTFNGPTDVAWDAKGNIFIADGYGNARIVKLSPTGAYIKAWGGRGRSNGQFGNIHTLAVDARGNVYAGDQQNQRISVFDNDGNYLRTIEGIGTPAAICISPGSQQYLYSSNSDGSENFNHGEIYKIDLDGRVLGQFGTTGKRLKQFGSVNEIDCRENNVLYVAELTNWRVQKLILHSR